MGSMGNFLQCLVSGLVSAVHVPTLLVPTVLTLLVPTVLTLLVPTVLTLLVPTVLTHPVHRVYSTLAIWLFCIHYAGIQAR
jgi:hypothetical protein